MSNSIDITDNAELDEDMKSVIDYNEPTWEYNEPTWEVQTRSERNGIKNFSTLKEAVAHANKDTSVWKISFTLPSGERVRLVAQLIDEDTDMHDWVYDPIPRQG